MRERASTPQGLVHRRQWSWRDGRCTECGSISTAEAADALGRAGTHFSTAEWRLGWPHKLFIERDGRRGVFYARHLLAADPVDFERFAQNCRETVGVSYSLDGQSLLAEAPEYGHSRSGVVGGARWVGQEHENGCVIAVTAMIAGLSYAEAASLYQDFGGDGISNPRMDSCLAELGFAVARIYERKKSIWPPRPFADLHTATVEAEFGTGRLHQIVMLGDGTVLDPFTPAQKRLADYFRVHNVAAVVPVGR